ncbi:MAG TPA: TRAP transporter small permease [Spirochaetales bacterium]|nr:TRAP transporter small permease [Spirochaetales bacterium]HRY56349.1 TRAP transporter small permease [Spirochaetia bacterium]HRZ65477.1 TRAP transporter small permease [Spirochaetia bacterium]
MKKTLLLLRDLVELYLPAASFLVMFAAFILQVFTRYALNHPVTWTSDAIVIGFVWTVLLGACYAMRNRRHVKFTLIYEKLPPRAAAWTRLAGNLVIALTFALLVLPSVRYSLFLKFQKTPVFRVPYAYVFIPFAYFAASIVGYTLSELAEDLRVIAGKLPDSADHAKGGLPS